jgi:hypothetical protein
MRAAAILAAVFTVVAGCQDFGIEGPPDIPIAQLLQTPDTISADGKRIYLSTFLWRDYMPISPPEGKPLIAIVYLTTADSSQFPASITADAVWIVYNNEVWSSYFADQVIASEQPYRYARIAREGPTWGPGVRVEVVVRVYSSRGNAQLLRASRQWIHRTD